MVFYASAPRLSTQGGDIRKVSLEKLVGDYENQHEQELENKKKRKLLLGKRDTIPVFDNVCDNCTGEAATMWCYTCDKFFCDEHDESEHAKITNQTPMHRRNPVKPN